MTSQSLPKSLHRILSLNYSSRKEGVDKPAPWSLYSQPEASREALVPADLVAWVDERLSL
jgi:hypothetical protein